MADRRPTDEHAPPPAPPPAGTSYSDAEQAEVRKRLEDLGYVE